MTKNNRTEELLRVEFYGNLTEFAGKENSAIDPYPMQRIADWWLAKLSQAKLETLEAIIKEVGGMKRDRVTGGFDGQNEMNIEIATYNEALFDLLTTLQAELTLLKNER